MRTRLGYQGIFSWIKGVLGYETGLTTSEIAEAYATPITGTSYLQVAISGVSVLQSAVTGTSEIDSTITGVSRL